MLGVCFMKKIITIIFVIAFVAISGYFIYLDISQIETLIIPSEKCSDLLGVSPKTFVKTQGYDTFFEKRYRYAKVDDNGNLVLYINEDQNLDVTKLESFIHYRSRLV